MRTLLLACVLFAGVFSAAADDIANWPRRDVLEIQPVTPRVKALLQESDYVVDAEHPPFLRVHASAQDRRELDALGITYLVVGHEPNPPKFDKGATLGQYHSHADMTARLQSYAEDFPNLCRLVSLGNSNQGRALWAMRITDNPDLEEDEPEFKYLSTVHGDEPVGTELCLYLIDLLLKSYGQESVQGARLTQLVDSTDIWIVPLMNPDGHNAGARGNSNGTDMNRDFPSYVLEPAARGTIFDGTPLFDAGRETETRLVMQWAAENSLVLSANIHTGALVVNYPFDEPASAYTASPDDSLFVDVSLRYSENNPPLFNSVTFDDGIVNGAQWYTIYGGMQDWHYRYLGCNEVTLELSNIKKPAQAGLSGYWENNRESMLSYMEAVHIGVRGLVTDADSGEPVYAEIIVDDNTQRVYTDPDVGDYHRMLLPGTYSYTVAAPGYRDARVENVVVGAGAAVRRDIALQLDVEGDPNEGTLEGEEDGETAAALAQLAAQALGGFLANDTDGNDLLDFDELSGLLEITLQEFAALDKNGDDSLSTAELQVRAGEAAPIHNADQDADGAISMSELLRVIQFYNASGYRCSPQAASEDGYLVGILAPNQRDPACPPHASDYAPENGALSLSEMLRAVQLFNLGQYHFCEESGEGDSFCGGSA